VRRCVFCRLVQRLISRLIAAFVYFLLKDLHQSVTNSTNDLSVNVADPEAWVFRWLRFYHIICRYFAHVCYKLGCCEFVRIFTLYVFCDVCIWCTLSI